jgi:pimeloyl-ACP methyl ester carboxylesterase
VRRALVGLFAAVVALGLADGGEPIRAQGALEWRRCGERPFECATLAVPLDYGDPSGPTIELALIRAPAEDPDRRIGALFTNPGGPGGEGIGFLRAWSTVLDDDIRERFDLVGFDPRGVGQSGGIACNENLQAYIAADPSPDSEAEWDTLERETVTLAENCAKRYAEILPHLGTRNVARDLDSIRVAMGEPQINYVGYSYGTVIGQVYADLFPGSIRAFVLDGAVDLALGSDERNFTQILGFELALGHFVEHCREESCVLTDFGDPGEVVDRVIAAAEEAPIPAPGADRDAGPGEVFLGIIQPLYADWLWPSLETALADAAEGDGTALVRLADDYLDRREDGSYGHQLEANVAINCLDNGPSELPTEYAEYPRAAADFAEEAPHFGAITATGGLSCDSWAAKPDPLEAPSAEGIPPILVVSTTGDPATPYEWGVAVAEQLPNAVLLSYGGEGHTVYGGRDGCVDRTVNAFLIDLEPPGPGAFCGDEELRPAPPTEEPDGETPAEEDPGDGEDLEDEPSAEPSGVTPRPGSDDDGGDGPGTWVWVAGAVVALAVLGASVYFGARAVGPGR